MFIQITRPNGQASFVNGDNIAVVRDRQGDKPTVLQLVDGTDFEVQESYEEIVASLQA